MNLRHSRLRVERHGLPSIYVLVARSYKADNEEVVRGLPNFLTGGVNRPVPESVAASWLIIAEACVNPFDP